MSENIRHTIMMDQDKMEEEVEKLFNFYRSRGIDALTTYWILKVAVEALKLQNDISEETITKYVHDDGEVH